MTWLNIFYVRQDFELELALQLEFSNVHADEIGPKAHSFVCNILGNWPKDPND